MKITKDNCYKYLISTILIMAVFSYGVHFRNNYYTFFQSLITILFFVLFFLTIKDKRYSQAIQKNIFCKNEITLMLVFMFINTVLGYVFYGYNSIISIISSFSFIFTAITTFYILPLLIKKDVKIKNRIINLYITMTSILSIFSVILWLNNNSFLGYGLINIRNASMLYDPNFLSTTVGVGLFLVLMGEMKNNVKIPLFIFHAISMFLSGSRGGLLSAFLAFFIYYIFFSKQGKRKKIMFLLISSVISLIFLGYLYYNTSFFRVFQGDNYRSEMINFAIKMCLKSPIIGYGYQSTSNILKLLGGIAGGHASTHNSYIDFLLSYGFPTFILYCTTLIKILFRSIKNNDDEMKKYICCMIFMMINANTILYSFGGVGAISIMFTLMLGIVNIYSLDKMENNK